MYLWKENVIHLYSYFYTDAYLQEKKNIRNRYRMYFAILLTKKNCTIDCNYMVQSIEKEIYSYHQSILIQIEKRKGKLYLF